MKMADVQRRADRPSKIAQADRRGELGDHRDGALSAPEASLQALQRRSEGNRGVRETAQLSAAVSGAAGEVVQPMMGGDGVEELEEKVDKGKKPVEPEVVEPFGPQMVVPQSPEQLTRDLSLFFRSVIAGREVDPTVSEAAQGAKLTWIPIRWTFSGGNLRGVGFNIHVDANGTLSAGSSWIRGVNGAEAPAQDLDVNFGALIGAIQGTAGEALDIQVQRGQEMEKQRAQTSDDRFSKLGDLRRGGGQGSSSGNQPQSPSGNRWGQFGNGSQKGGPGRFSRNPSDSPDWRSKPKNTSGGRWSKPKNTSEDKWSALGDRRKKDGDGSGTQQLRAVQRRAETDPADGGTGPAERVQGGLPTELRSGLEQLSGVDLSDVRVRYDSPKPAQLAAHAYAQGSEIHLAPGQERHLPHEGWHVVQQKQGRVRPTTELGGTAINDDPGLEREADVMGARAAGVTQRVEAEATEPAVIRREKAGSRVVLDVPEATGVGGGAVVQEANIRWTSEPPPRIEDIDFGPRSGAQEDHTTAFTTFQLAVLNNLRGQTIDGAVIQLYLLANEITELPAYGDYRNRYLGNQVEALKATLLSLHEQATGNPLYAVGELGKAIDDYLRIRNLVPGTHFPRSDVERPADYKGGGAMEKVGKGELVDALGGLEAGGDFGSVEEALRGALSKLHDYITSRKTLPTMEELAKIAAQHFHSVMQVSPRLYTHAEEILDLWMNDVYNRWSKVIPMEWVPFVRAVVGMSETYVEPIGGRRGDGTDSPSHSTASFGLPMTESGIRGVNAEDLSRDQRVALLNRMIAQNNDWAIRLAQYLFEHPDQRDAVLDNLGVRFLIAPDGRVGVRLRGG